LRSNFGLIQHFDFFLGWIGRRTNVLRPGIGEVPEQLMRVKPGDACVALSFRRYAKGTVEILKGVRKAGAKVIAMTDSELAPIAEDADATLVLPVDFPSFFQSHVAVLSLMNALIRGVAERDREFTLEALRRHETAWLANGIYVNGNIRARLKAEIDAFAAPMRPVEAGARRVRKPAAPRRPGKKR
jgi:DNA-binding MurR/RpiR family transcriptional regulator